MVVMVLNYATSFVLICIITARASLALSSHAVDVVVVKPAVADLDAACAQPKRLRSSHSMTSMSLTVSLRKPTGIPNGTIGLSCGAIYASAAQQLLQRRGLTARCRAALETVLPLQSNMVGGGEQALLLRHALGMVLAGKELESLDKLCAGNTAAGAVLHDFRNNNGIALSYSVVNDGVMGGKSTSGLSLTAEGAIFRGFVTRENGGGFASVRFDASDTTALVQRLRTGSGIKFTVQHIEGCTAWKFQLLSDGFSIFGPGWVQWQADFTANGDGASQYLAFSDLVPTRYGKPLGGRGLGNMDLGGIEGFGFMLSFLDDQGQESSAFHEGPFALKIVSVEVS